MRHFGTASFLLKPVKRLTTNFGYSIVSAKSNEKPVSAGVGAACKFRALWNEKWICGLQSSPPPFINTSDTRPERTVFCLKWGNDRRKIGHRLRSLPGRDSAWYCQERALAQYARLVSERLLAPQLHPKEVTLVGSWP